MDNNYHGCIELALCPACVWACRDGCTRIIGVRGTRVDCPEFQMHPAMLAGSLRQTFGDAQAPAVVDDGTIGRPTDIGGVILPTDEDLLDLADPDIMGISDKHPNCMTCGVVDCGCDCTAADCCTFFRGSSGYLWKDIDKES